MLGIATGCIGLGTDTFYNLTPAQFDAIYTQWFTRQEHLEKERWEQTRWLMWASMRPFAKRLRPADIMHFAWDGERHEKPAAEKSSRERFEQLTALWNDKTTHNGNE